VTKAAKASIGGGAVDGVLEHLIGPAIAAADQAHFVRIVLGLEHGALLG
jgi:hypothetical protein